MKIGKTAAAALILSLSLALTACVVEEEETDAITETETETATETEKETETETETEPALPVIGEEAEGENILTAKIKNGTGMDITGVSVKYPSLEEYPGSMLPGDEVFADGETRILYYDSTDALEADAAEKTDPEDKDGNIDYTIELTFDDETAVLHNFPFGDAEEIEIHAKEDVVYLTYRSIATGEPVTTEEAERAIKVEEEKAQQDQQPETQATQPATQAPQTETQEPQPETQAPQTETQAPQPDTQAPQTDAAAPGDPDGGCLSGDPDDGCLGGDDVVVIN